MSDIDFNTIAPRSGSQQNAFEELCCQLAAKACPAGSVFERFRGAGGDGGVECVAQLADKTIVGWQAKFVFDVEGLITQASKSLATASKIYPSLAKYIVCFPFDPTGPTGRGLAKKRGRPAKSGSEKLKEWMEQEVAAAKAAGRSLVIELWPAHFLQSHLVANDRSGGIRHYFFSAETLSNEWFKAHVESALVKAGPRYNTPLRRALHRLYCQICAPNSVPARTVALLGQPSGMVQRAFPWDYASLLHRRCCTRTRTRRR